LALVETKDLSKEQVQFSSGLTSKNTAGRPTDFWVEGEQLIFGR